MIPLSNSWGSLENDPLTDSQRLNIKYFIDSQLLTDTEMDEPYGYGSRTRKMDIFEAAHAEKYSALTALSKTYDSYDRQNLKAAADVFKAQGRDFTLLRKALKTPEALAGCFGIDASKPDQVFAAQQYLKIAIRGMQCHCTTSQLYDQYRDKMASNHGRYSSTEISLKKKMLMQNDPVRKLDPSKPVTSLDTVLAHTYFIEPQQTQTTTSSDGKGNSKTTTQTYGPTREEARGIIARELTKLWNSPDTRYIVEALGLLIQREKGDIFFSNFPMGVGRLGIPYGSQSDLFGGVQGFYNSNHSIMMASLINPFDNKVIRSTLTTFVHETLHFLFSRIVKNGCSPVKAGSPEERLLDEALQKDREHRLKLLPLSQTAQNNDKRWQRNSVEQTLVDNLEKKNNYFPGGFNPNNPAHLQTMRSEAIVRMEEQLAIGVSHETLKEVAPNLYEFYFTHAKPLIETYILENRHQNDSDDSKIN